MKPECKYNSLHWQVTKRVFLILGVLYECIIFYFNSMFPLCFLARRVFYISLVYTHRYGMKIFGNAVKGPGFRIGFLQNKLSIISCLLFFIYIF